VTISDFALLSSIETVVKPGISSEKSTHLIELGVRKPYWCDISRRNEELRLNNLCWVRICQFQTPGQKLSLQMPLLTEQFFFSGDDWNFLKEGVKTYLIALM
jgi:hypothetical protein